MVSAIEIIGCLNRDDWSNTPLGVLYDKYIKDGKTHNYAWTQAGQEEGKILKKVIKLYKRKFATEETYPARKYKWVTG